MKVVEVLKKIGDFDNVCIRPKDKHPHDMEALFGCAKDILDEHGLHLALKRSVYRIIMGEWEHSHCIFIIYR